MAKDEAEAELIGMSWFGEVQRMLVNEGPSYLLSTYGGKDLTARDFVGMLGGAKGSSLRFDLSQDARVYAEWDDQKGLIWLKTRVSWGLQGAWWSPAEKGQIPAWALTQTPAPASQVIVHPALSSPQPSSGTFTAYYAGSVNFYKPGYQTTISLPPTQPKPSGPPCPKCGGPTTLLFIHSVCDRCEPPGGQPASAPDRGGYRGFVVWRNPPVGTAEYVFQTRGDAERWRHAAGIDHYPIREVTSPTEFEWRTGTGSVPNLQLANRLYYVYRHGAEPKDRDSPNAFLTEA